MKCLREIKSFHPNSGQGNILRDYKTKMVHIFIYANGKQTKYEYSKLERPNILNEFIDLRSEDEIILYDKVRNE